MYPVMKRLMACSICSILFDATWIPFKAKCEICISDGIRNGPPNQIHRFYSWISVYHDVNVRFCPTLLNKDLLVEVLPPFGCYHHTYQQPKYQQVIFRFSIAKRAGRSQHIHLKLTL